MAERRRSDTGQIPDIYRSDIQRRRLKPEERPVYEYALK
jgi:hypothetical protein